MVVVVGSFCGGKNRLVSFWDVVFVGNGAAENDIFVTFGVCSGLGRARYGSSWDVVFLGNGATENDIFVSFGVCSGLGRARYG